MKKTIKLLLFAAIYMLPLALFAQYTYEPPFGLTAISTSFHSATLIFTDPIQTNSTMEVQYRPEGDSIYQSAYTSNSHHIVLTGLDSLVTYTARVRRVEGYYDTSAFSNDCQFTTVPYNRVAFNYDTSMSKNWSTWGLLGSPSYNHTYTQTIIDSAFLTTLAGREISYLGYINPQDRGATSCPVGSNNTYASMDVYMANIPDSCFTDTIIFSNTTDHVFVKVFDNADLNFDTLGWHLFQMDNTFQWDGHSNILITAIRNNPAGGLIPYFSVHNTTSPKTCCGVNVFNNVSLNNLGSSGNYVGLWNVSTDIMLIATCGIPTSLSASNINGESATVSWSGASDTYEIQLKTDTENEWQTPITVSGNSTTLTGLLDTTLYHFHIRSLCVEEESSDFLYSDWSEEDSFTTLFLPCNMPTGIIVTDTTFESITLDWTENNTATQWNVHIWNTQYDTFYTTTSHPFTANNLMPNTDYYVAVSSQCSIVKESDYSDTLTFHTPSCPTVTDLTVVELTSTTATLSWEGNATGYDIEYGNLNFEESTKGTQIVHTENNYYTLVDLEPAHDYSVHVRAEYREGLYSDYCAQVDFTTLAPGEGIETAGNANVTILPNPTSDATTIAISGINGQVTISLADLNGRIVLSEQITCSGDCVKQLQVSNLVPGAYLVRLDGAQINIVKRLVVK